jgi:putative membrane protein insertion efficiency factor
MLKTFILYLLKIYQRFFTLIGYGSCRYYPTCSEYAKQQFEKNRLDKAFFHSITRILRCNQLFDGGIDYPSISCQQFCKPTKRWSKKTIKYWYVPKKDGTYHMIKNFDFMK